jgi:hypothetical protein
MKYGIFIIKYYRPTANIMPSGKILEPFIVNRYQKEKNTAIILTIQHCF